jgi:hypothetical protein
VLVKRFQKQAVKRGEGGWSDASPLITNLLPRLSVELSFEDDVTVILLISSPVFPSWYKMLDVAFGLCCVLGTLVRYVPRSERIGFVRFNIRIPYFSICL